VKAKAVGTVGVFDGYHRGHAAVVRRAVEAAHERGVCAVVFTFDPHPKAVLRAEGAPPVLTPVPRKLELLRRAGAETIHVLPFDREMASLSPEVFLEREIHRRCRLVGLVVGHDFALGRDRTGSVDRLRAIGAARDFFVEQVPPLVVDGSPVSSSRVREAIGAGEVEGAATLLGRDYSLEGEVVPGDGRGRGLGFPTANLAPARDRLLPGTGVYAVRVLVVPGGVFPAVANLGRRPTFAGKELRMEVHLLDFEGDVVGLELTVEFLRRLRGERKFNDGGALADQIRRDIAEARRVLAG